MVTADDVWAATVSVARLELYVCRDDELMRRCEVAVRTVLALPAYADWQRTAEAALADPRRSWELSSAYQAEYDRRAGPGPAGDGAEPAQDAAAGQTP